MSRYTGSVYRKARRLGFSVTETGKEIAKRPNIPGQHVGNRGKKLSNYGTQLQEKQKLRFMYGLTEKQFRKTFNEAGKMKGVHGEDLLKLLESRVDNLVYRIGFATTRRGARQLVIKENDKELAIVKSSLETKNNRVEFVTYDENKMAGTYVRYPERSELNADINESLIVEFYNR